MKNTDRFWVEKRDLDFPFYNDETVGKRDLILLTLGVILFSIWAFLPKGSLPSLVSRSIYFVLTTVPFLIVARGKLRLLVKRFRFYDLVLILVGAAVCFFGSMFLLALLFNHGLISEGSFRANPVVDATYDGAFAVGFVLQLFGEEMLKIDAFLVILTLIYRRTGKRKLGVIVGMLVSALLFGALHYEVYGSWILVLVAQNFSGLVLLYLYLRTKNVFVPFWAHLLLDCVALLGATGTEEAAALLTQLLH